MPDAGALTAKDFETLAAFRGALRRFLSFSEAASARVGLTPRQYEALLSLKGHGGSQPLTVGGLAERLCVRHHSAVELVNRLARIGLAVRVGEAGDRRRIHIVLTRRGERALARLAASHRAELRQAGPRLLDVLGSLAAKRGAGRT